MKLERYLGCARCIVLVAGLTACGVPGIPKPPSLDLPQPVSDLRAIRKGDSVYLGWSVPAKTTDFLAIRRPGITRICRSTSPAMTDCAAPAGEVAAPSLAAAGAKQIGSSKALPKLQSTYKDSVPQSLLSADPSAQLFYAVSVLNQNGRTAGLSNVVTVPAIVAPPPPSGFQAHIVPEGVLLTWTPIPHPAEISGIGYAYRAYRRPEGGDADTIVGELPLDTTSPTQLLDHSFEWEKAYSYRVTVVTFLNGSGKPESQFESDDSTSATVLAHDIFAPSVPSGLQAVFSGVGQQPFIDLIWAPDTDADLAGYNVYRREESGESRKMNTELVKPPAFRDLNVTAGHTYFYSVTAVDARGNESARSGEESERVP
ncbi:MAG: hypothetical protein WB952_10040 [Terriglobales bacterium]